MEDHATIALKGVHKGKALAELSVKSRLITMTGYRTFAEAGGLMSYGANFFDSYKAAAPNVDKILKGDKPPICQLISPAGLNLS